MTEQYRMCSRCLYDTTIPDIRFDEKGVCNFCKIHDEMVKIYPLGEEGQALLDGIVQKIKKAGRGKEYDCVVGLSGGRDSSYMLYMAVNLGLRPLAVHFDNGWNSEIAVTNIQKLTSKYNVDLETVVADWEEFKDLQISFLKASTSDAEIPTDVAIHATLNQVAAKLKIKYILNGHSFRNEGIVPIGWTYMDGRYINSVQKRFGHTKIKSFENVTISSVLYYNIIKGIRAIPILNYIPYDKKQAGIELEKETGWVDYGMHHHESVYTIFFQSYYLPQKFHIDKRRLSWSARIRTGLMTRDEALAEIEKEPYPCDMDTVDYTMKKLGLSKAEFDDIMQQEIKSFHDYPTYFPLIKACRIPLSIGFKMGLVPSILYYKYVV